jgi:hypothetical protein
MLNLKDWLACAGAVSWKQPLLCLAAFQLLMVLGKDRQQGRIAGRMHFGHNASLQGVP